MTNLLSYFISTFFILAGFFILLISGAGSHGHFGLFSHADSFLLYALAVLAFSFSLPFLLLTNRRSKSIINLSLFIAAIVLAMIVAFVHEFFSEKPNIRPHDYVLIVILIVVNGLIQLNTLSVLREKVN